PPVYAQKNKQQTFRVAVIGDVQVGDFHEIDYANQTLMPELIDLKEIDFALFLGDLVNNDPSLFPYVKEMTEQLPYPSRFVFGNHDRDIGPDGIRDSIFKVHFGPTHYAFDRNGVHFIVLNNIYPKGKLGYEGLISEEQLDFVRNDLKKIPNDRLLVVCQHIPLVHTKNKQDLIRLFQGRKHILFLSAHTHTLERHFISEEGVFIHELIAGTSCGNWWVGERDWNGIPAAMMQCGSPRNYFLINFNKNAYTIQFKGIGKDANKQMNIWVEGQDTISTLTALPNDKNNIIANIFGASDSTLVMMQIDNGEPVRMAKTAIIDPDVHRMISWNRSVYPTAYSKRSALRKLPSPHILTSSFPDGLSPGIHKIKITAKDNFGFEVVGYRTFTVKNISLQP
ncbi:MAG: calcineurin-like phosphoesterase C-terminal domain-containing protein, partial [Dysgonamonadaceae bacterium]|nr:calcineurin-like phosphoesterase C-terminal domain-containing protein [Dysgonamonadaceae bacterium]